MVTSEPPLNSIRGITHDTSPHRHCPAGGHSSPSPRRPRRARGTRALRRPDHRRSRPRPPLQKRHAEVQISSNLGGDVATVTSFLAWHPVRAGALAVVLVVALSVAWYLGSPLFIRTYTNEALPPVP